MTTEGRPSDSAPGVVAARVLGLLRARGETLATAESLTGGLIGEILTGIPGASAAYVGGVISYATRLKSTLAGVPAQTLDELGPVASRTAEQMALGVATRCEADWGLAATGVAGPERQDGHPVGQVFLAVGRPSTSYCQVRELALTGSRNDIRHGAATQALYLVEEVLGMNVGATLVD